MKEIKCTEYMEADYDEPLPPCKCPTCGAFLKWIAEGDKELKPVCNKCKAELIAIPYEDEIGYGKICPISPPKKKELTEK